MAPLKYEGVQLALHGSNLPTIAQHMFSLMMRNMSSDGFAFADPCSPGSFSKPGCIIAAPCSPVDFAIVNQDYVFNWTRDAAITAMELVAASMPIGDGEGVQALIDYVNFANICQNSGAPTIGHACYTIEGQPRPSSEQSDGPALQTLAIIRAFPQLDTAAQATARSVISANIAYLIGTYQNPTANLWEERDGYSFFARSVQLRCFQELENNTDGILVPQSIADAITWLENALQKHWNGTYYVTILAPPLPGEPPSLTLPMSQAYNPNMDIIMAAIYGGIPCTDTKLLATAAQIRRQWADISSPSFYPINAADQSRGIGPMLGRYPSDIYDGDATDPFVGGHPWPVCTCNFAELYYRVANAVGETRTVPFDYLSKDFFNLIGIDANTSWRAAVNFLQSAGDKMLYAVIFHSNHLELSEQNDRMIGYEKSVRDFTWSYAAFISAVRAKTGKSVMR